MTKRKPTRKGYTAKGFIDWRNGGIAHESPRSFQARAGGPPLLFMTDIRMSVLVTLAVAPTPYQIFRLEEILEVSNLNPCINALVTAGILAKWSLSPRASFVSLDPCHPCYESLLALLRGIGDAYAFPRPLYLFENFAAGAAPVRRSRRRDARLTFGNAHRTLVLLAVYVLGSASMSDIQRAISLFEKTLVNRTLWRFHAAGVLRSNDHGGRKGISFELDPKFAFAEEIKAVLASVATALPVWVHVIKQYRLATAHPMTERRRSRAASPSDTAMRRWSKVPRPL